MVVPYHSEALLLVNQLLTEIQSNVSDQRHVFALLVIGEIGRHIDLSRVDGLKEVYLFK